MWKQAFAIAILAACNAGGDSALLDHAELLAVRADPPHVMAGQRAHIDVLASDDAGRVFEADPDTVQAGPLPVEHTDMGWFVTAPPAEAMVAGATLAIELAIDGETKQATKQIVFGDSAANPAVAMMRVDGSDAPALFAAVGDRPALSATATGVEPLAYAWYSSVGDVEHARQPDAILDANKAEDGTIVVVVRDAQGGVAWQLLPATVN
jgi:hypothetical protein